GGDLLAADHALAGGGVDGAGGHQYAVAEKRGGQLRRIELANDLVRLRVGKKRRHALALASGHHQAREVAARERLVEGDRVLELGRGEQLLVVGGALGVGPVGEQKRRV